MHQKKCSQCASSFPLVSFYVYDLNAFIFHGMEEVVGSIPTRSTNKPLANQ
jgi:hypothetical protein